jgi:hypothetical protein
VLATSRQPLGLDDEVVTRLSPLSVPSVHGDVTTLGDNPAVELFMKRAESANADIEIGPHELRLAASICASLDGIPLAIELAASRVISFSLDEIDQQITEDSTDLATIGRERGDHHDTVHASIEWSHQLLTPPEQALHRRLSLIPGAFTSSPAEALMRDLASPADTRTKLGRLVNRSMLTSLGSTCLEFVFAAGLICQGRIDLARPLIDSGIKRCSELGSQVSAQLAERLASLLASGRPLGGRQRLPDALVELGVRLRILDTYVPSSALRRDRWLGPIQADTRIYARLTAPPLYSHP